MPGYTIIVAEDEVMLRALVRNALEDGRIRILEASDGTEALELAHREDPDLLLLDWMMPEKTGIQVLQALRDDPRTQGIPVVMMTSRCERADRDLAESFGIQGYLVKPFSLRDLAELVHKVLSEAWV